MSICVATFFVAGFTPPDPAGSCPYFEKIIPRCIVHPIIDLRRYQIYEEANPTAQVQTLPRSIQAGSPPFETTKVLQQTIMQSCRKKIQSAEMVEKAREPGSFSSQEDPSPKVLILFSSPQFP